MALALASEVRAAASTVKVITSNQRSSTDRQAVHESAAEALSEDGQQVDDADYDLTNMDDGGYDESDSEAISSAAQRVPCESLLVRLPPLY